MANTNTDLLYPEFWFDAFDPLEIGSYNLQNAVSRDAEKMLRTAQKGDSVNIPITPDLGDADDWTPGDSITASNFTQETAQVVLSRSKKKTIGLTGKEMSMSPYDLIQTYGVPLAKTLMKAVNLDIYLEAMKTPYFVDAISAFDEDKIVDAKTKLGNNEVSSINRKLIAGVDNIGKMLKLDAFQHVNLVGDQVAMKEGAIQRKFGFDVMENNIISKYTPADLVGAINNVAGYSAGATSIVVDGFNDDANPIRVGDVFIIAGETGTPYHTVTAVSTTSSDTTGITFTPALVGSVADDAAVTVTATQSILAMTPNALAFGARVLDSLPDGTGVRHTSGIFNNIPVRISVWHDGNLGIKVQFDTLYGVKMVNNKRVTRILTT